MLCQCIIIFQIQQLVYKLLEVSIHIHGLFSKIYKSLVYSRISSLCLPLELTLILLGITIMVTN